MSIIVGLSTSRPARPSTAFASAVNADRSSVPSTRQSSRALCSGGNVSSGISKADKRCFYTTTIGSATESAGMLDVCLRRQLMAAEARQRGKQLLDRIVALLVKLCRVLRDG